MPSDLRRIWSSEPPPPEDAPHREAEASGTWEDERRKLVMGLPSLAANLRAEGQTSRADIVLLAHEHLIGIPAPRSEEAAALADMLDLHGHRTNNQNYHRAADILRALPATPAGDDRALREARLDRDLIITALALAAVHHDRERRQSLDALLSRTLPREADRCREVAAHHEEQLYLIGEQIGLLGGRHGWPRPTPEDRTDGN